MTIYTDLHDEEEALIYTVLGNESEWETSRSRAADQWVGVIEK